MPSTSTQPSLARSIIVAVLAIALAVGLDLVISRIAAASGVSSFSPATNASAILRLGTMFCIVGAGVFFAIRYLVKWRPALVWRIVAYCAMVASFSPDLRMLGGAWANLPNLPGFPSFGGGPGGRPPGGFGGGNATNGSANSTSGFPRGGGGGGAPRGQAVAFLVVMHAVAAIVLTEALARWAMPAKPAA